MCSGLRLIGFLHFVQLASIPNYTQLSFQFIRSLPAAGDKMYLSFKHIALPNTAQKALGMLLRRSCMIFEGAESGTYHPDSFGNTT